MTPPLPSFCRARPPARRGCLPALRAAAVVAVLLGWGALAAAAPPGQPSKATSTVYVCTDAHGRRLTSDRPIIDCINREQQKFDRTGTARIVPPARTAAERDAEEARLKREQAEKARADQERVREFQREQLLVSRYPDRRAHDAARMEALSGPQALIKAAQVQMKLLEDEHAKLDTEMEFYAKDPTKAPARIRRQYGDIAQQMRVQADLIAGQFAEMKRINQRYTEELASLQGLWSRSSQSAARERAPAAPTRTP